MLARNDIDWDQDKTTKSDDVDNESRSGRKGEGSLMSNPGTDPGKKGRCHCRL
jgi:hypothetical protein